jgi:arylsulfatase A-like enzyme
MPKRHPGGSIAAFLIMAASLLLPLQQVHPDRWRRRGLRAEGSRSDSAHRLGGKFGRTSTITPLRGRTPTATWAVLLCRSSHRRGGKARGIGSLGVAIALLLSCITPTFAGPRKPDVIVILADDLGYGDTGAYGSKIAKTPNIDALAESGIRFTDGYVTDPVCAPSRAGLMTGRYQQRFGYEFNPGARDRTGGMSLHEITLAQIMKSAGYTTGAIGKWHLGIPGPYYPTARGFDYFFGMAGGGSDYIIDPKPGDEFIAKGRGGQVLDITIPAAGLSALPCGQRLKAALERIRARHPITRNGKVMRVDEYLTDAFTQEAVSFINRNRGHPFFLYLAQHVPHVPLQAPRKYIARFRDIKDPGKRVYAAMVSALDDSVGAVIATLKKDGLYENTMVIFLSDNGCAGYVYGACSNAPLSGYKRWLAEGGIRIPYIVSWPGHLPAGRVDHRPVSSLDIFPTAAALAHASLPTDRVYDGVNLVPFLDGKNNGIPNPKLYWRDGVDFAMRDADSKLWICAIAPRKRGSIKRSKESRQGLQADEGWADNSRSRNRFKWVVPTVGPQGTRVMLFNLADDIGELHNIASIHPAEVARMESEIAAWNKTLVKPQWPQSKHSTVDFDGQDLELFY